jgi:hypothetical protein
MYMKYIVILMLLFMNHCNDFAPLLDNKILIAAIPTPPPKLN